MSTAKVYPERTPAAEMLRSRRARQVAVGVYQVRGREGLPYTQHLTATGLECNCPDGGRRCFHAKAALRLIRRQIKQLRRARVLRVVA